MKHPMQPIHRDSAGVVRFVENRIVRHVLAESHLTLDDLFSLGYDPEDYEQVIQLVGFSVSGFGDMPHVNPNSVAIADKIADGLK